VFTVMLIERTCSRFSFAVWFRYQQYCSVS